MIYFRFVLVNSIALQGDDCSMCSEAMTQLMAVAEKLNCHRERTKKDIYEDLVKKQKPFCELPKDSPAPILIQVSSFWVTCIVTNIWFLLMLLINNKINIQVMRIKEMITKEKLAFLSKETNSAIWCNFIIGWCIKMMRSWVTGVALAFLLWGLLDDGTKFNCYGVI